MGFGSWLRTLRRLLGGGPRAPGPAVARLNFKDSFESGTARHSDTNGYWLGRAAELAYQDAVGFKTAVENWGLRSEYVSVGDTQAHVVANDDLMIVAFRGTETNPGDIATDARFKLTMWTGPGKVHSGFLRAFDGEPWEKVSEKIRAQARPGQSLWFTGHSLGGALAVLAAMRWTLDGLNPGVSGLYTIGQPRVGDRTFATELERMIGERTFRYVNNRDVVPRVPMRLMGYDHAGTVLYFDSGGQIHTDPSLWLRLLDTAFTDLSSAKESLKETVGDHRAAEYVARLRLAISA